MYSVHVYYYGEPTVCTQCMCIIMVNLLYVLSACVYYGEPTVCTQCMYIIMVNLVYVLSACILLW